MKLNDMLPLLEAKFGNPERLLKKYPVLTESCEYAIGGPECRNCSGAMNYSG